MPICITFGTKEYQQAIDKLHKSMSRFMYTKTFNEKSVEMLFDAYPEHLYSSRGYGWWLWKPYLIDYILSIIDEGEYVMYLDSTIECLKNPKDLIKEGENIKLFHNGQRHVDWCKSETYYDMGVVCMPDQLQANAAIQIYRNTPETRAFVQEYFNLCSQLMLVNDEFNPDYQLSGFKGHRHDQSILTNLAVKYNIKLNTSPCQWGMGANAYFNHHRTI